MTLDDSARVLAVACMLIASRNEGSIPDDLAYLKRVAYLNRTPNLKPLIDCGFLEPASDCKQMLADARPETETETDIKETSAPKNGAASKSVDNSPILESLLLDDGSEFQVRQSLVAQLEPLYPAVDIPATVREMKGWLVLNPDRRKTRRGVKSFIGKWLQREQVKHGG